MNKEEVYQYLTEKNIEYEFMEHKAVFNMEELEEIELPHPEWEAKNLFVRDDKKKNYYLITVKGEKRVNLKEFAQMHGLRRLSFASSDDLMKYLGLIPGSVTPLGLLNDQECKVHFYLDKEFEGEMIGVHSNDNTATVWLQAEALVKLLREHGSEVEIVDIHFTKNFSESLDLKSTPSARIQAD